MYQLHVLKCEGKPIGCSRVPACFAISSVVVHRHEQTHLMVFSQEKLSCTLKFMGQHSHSHIWSLQEHLVVDYDFKSTDGQKLKQWIPVQLTLS